MSGFLSENLDADREILLRINDERTFLSVCAVDKYARKLCNENLFRQRMELRYPRAAKEKPSDMSWRKYYLLNQYYADKLKTDFDFDYHDGDAPYFYKFLQSFTGVSPEDLFSTRVIEALGNNIDLVNYFIEAEMYNNPAIYRLFLKIALQKDDLEFYKFLLSKITDKRAFRQMLNISYRDMLKEPFYPFLQAALQKAEALGIQWSASEKTAYLNIAEELKQLQPEYYRRVKSLLLKYFS